MMDIIRSKLNLANFVDNDWFGYIVNIFNSEKVLSTWKKQEIDDSDADNKIAKFYINDDIYIEMTYTPAKFLMDFHAYGVIKNMITVINTSHYLNYLIIYKQNNYTGFAFNNSSTTAASLYPLTTNIVVDSINNNPDNITAIYLGSTTYAYSSVTPNKQLICYQYYTSNSNITTNTIQLVPYVLSAIDAQFDTIHGVCISPVMNRFITFNNDEQWLLSSNIAIPCGDEINYYYID